MAVRSVSDIPESPPRPDSGAALASSSGTRRYELLASALSGRRVTVTLSGSEPYTDGQTIFLGDRADEWQVLVPLVVQASLLAEGSLQPEFMARLVGQRETALRYFSLEVARVTRCAENRLPRWLCAILQEHRIAEVPGSRDESLARATRRGAIPLPPPSFGTIRPKEVAKRGVLNDGHAATPGDRNGITPPKPSVDLPDLTDEDDAEEFKLLKALSAGGSGSAPLTKLLQKLFGGGKRSRQGPPSGGDEVPVGTTVAVSRVGPHAKSVPGDFSLSGHDPAARVDGVYPEWDCRTRRYRRGWCWVTEYEAPAKPPLRPIPRVSDPQLRRKLVRLGLSLERHRRQADGDELDLDPLIEVMVGRASGESSDERVYQTRRQTGHDLGVLLLLDASGSTEEQRADGPRTYDEQRQIAANLGSAFEDIGDRVAVFGFNSHGRQTVQFVRVKDFDDRFDHSALRRLGSLEPSGYTRMGAAIRHGFRLLTDKSGATNRVLVVISDGLPFDHGYEDDYAERDTRRALAEGRRDGMAAVCLSVVPSTRAAALERVFGTSAYLRLNHSSDLNDLIEDPLRVALRLAANTRRPTGASR